MNDEDNKIIMGGSDDGFGDDLEQINLPAEILSGQSISTEMIFSTANEMLDEMLNIKELMLYYSAAIQEIRTKLAILNKEYEVRYQRNPIHSIQSRLKSQVSIMQKLEKKGLLISRENIEENLYDIAGVRVICSYEDDIYRMAEALVKQEDIELVQTKDYIANPKPNGYRSLHLIVKVPVYFEEGMKKVFAEIQIRTVAMDFWASLEHQMKYKKKIADPEHIREQLKQCSDMITLTDRYMMKIRKEMDGIEPEKSEVEQLLEKLKRFGIQLPEE